jgi:hypothetical protein
LLNPIIDDGPSTLNPSKTGIKMNCSRCPSSIEPADLQCLKYLSETVGCNHTICKRCIADLLKEKPVTVAVTPEKVKSSPGFKKANDVIEIVDLTKDECVCTDDDNGIDDEVEVLHVKRGNGDSDSDPELVSSVSSKTHSGAAAQDNIKLGSKRRFGDVADNDKCCKQDFKPKAIKIEPKQENNFEECESESKPSSEIKNEHNEDDQLEDIQQCTDSCNGADTEQNRDVKVKIEDEMIKKEAGADNCNCSNMDQNEDVKIKVEDEKIKKEAVDLRKFGDRVLLARQSTKGMLKLGGGNVSPNMWWHHETDRVSC